MAAQWVLRWAGMWVAHSVENSAAR
jgi:hypothetical protein